jgi:hypothetical protein
MPLMGTETVLGAQIFSMVQAELSSTGHPPDPTSLPNLQAFCNGIAKAIVPHIVSFAQVAPGIPTAGSPASQVTVGPGTLL